MKILVTGATGYIGGAVATALLARGHDVVGLARSEQSAAKLRQRGLSPVAGDFGDSSSLAKAIATSDVDAVVSTASVGASQGDDADTFARDRVAVHAMQRALGGSGNALVFTSGSAVFGSFNGGNLAPEVHAEDAALPLPSAVFAPPSAHVHPMLAAGLGDAMAARVETENVVLADPGVRGIVVRPGLVYGNGGSLDVPAAIAMARANGCGVHLGAGATQQSYVHIDDLAELYCLAVERAPRGAILHGVVDDVSLRDVAAAISRMIGAGDRTASFTLEQMLGLNAVARLGLTLTKRLPPRVNRRLGRAFPPPPSLGTGISLCLNKRLSSDKTRDLVQWSPRRTDILEDVEFGSYARLST
jgi:nucleoside-diphosphate-sugar epimerase